MAFRAFYALPADNFVTESGQHTNAVYGFTSMLLSMIKAHKPTHVAVAFDLETPTLRSQEYAEYKGGRAKTPEEFKGQIPLIDQVMKALNVQTITVEGHEADDILATLATQGVAQGFQVLLVSGDRDAFQLINDDVTVLYPKKGVSDIPPLQSQDIIDKYQVTPAQYSDLAALVGESADNLPGVPGVGPKTAAKWINQYGGLVGILDNIEEIGGKVGDALREHVENVKRNRKLNHLLTDLDLPVNIDQMALEAPGHAEVEELFDALQFNTLRTRVYDTLGGQSGGDEPEAHQLQITDVDILCGASEMKAFLSEGAFALYLVSSTGAEGSEEVLGLAFANSNKHAVIDLVELDATAEAVLADYLASQSSPKIFHNAKQAYKLLALRGFELAGIVDDTKISAYLYQPGRRNYDLDALAELYLGITAEAQPSTQQTLSIETEGSAPGNAAATQAAMVFQLSEFLKPKLLERNALGLLEDMEIPLTVVLARMELAGIAADQKQLDTLLADYSSSIEQAKQAAFAEIGHEVNLGSPKQLQQVLFEELELPKTKKIKTGYSTDVEALNDLIAKTQHPFLVQLLAYRDATKLKQTVEGLQKSVASDGRIHTTYEQTVAATGRLSSINPNLQNIPVRSEAGRRIRDVFVVGHSESIQYQNLLTADYSQIEMRIMAHLSGDQGLITAFNEGEDLHRYVGSHIFQVEPEDVTSAMRSKVKAMSYGLVYGLSSFGLSKQLSIPVDEARTLMKDYFQRFGAVRDYLRDIVEQARSVGYTETILGRRRYLPDLTSTNRQLREMAERMALNAPIQGSAADIIKQAMLNVSEALVQGGYASRMLLQVHDELVLEIAPGEQDSIEKLVRSHMASAASLDVPLDVSIGIGKTWNEAAH